MARIGIGLDELRGRFESAGQGHVFRFWERLDGPARERLRAQAAGLDLAAVERIRAALARPEPPPTPALQPAPVLRLPERGGDAGLRERARRRGEALLAEGSVALLVVAGGEGTRLGFDGPKGAFPIGPDSPRSLFELLAQKVRGARRRSGAALPWCVMTSEPTDAAIRAFFAAHAFFGLPEADVLFFQQASTPALDDAGRLLMAAPDRIATSPGGHGGVIPALVESGVAERLAARGVRRLTTFQVDNPLVQVADPVYLGLHDLSGAEFSCKAVEKREPGERAGTLALLDGRLRVIEYSEIDAAHRDARAADDTLRFWAASIGMHVIDLALAERVAARADAWLPLHRARKRIPHLAEDGTPVEPSEPNGVKLERFVFDALAAAERAACLEVRREEEYSPVKNPSGGESPETARRDLRACYRRWLAAAGRSRDDGEVGELDHSRIDGPDDAIALASPLALNRAADQPAVSTATGATP